MDAGAYVDAFGNPSAAVAATAWTFTTLDNVPPVVSFSPPANLPKGGVSGQVFSVTATDNVSVASVVMSYRKVTATQYQTLNGTFNAATSKYDFPLQTTFFDDMGMEYFFTAKDGSNNTTLSPATGSYVTRLTFSATTIAVGVAAGSQVADYKIISIPLDLATTNIANIFADFGAPDGSQWKLLKYQANPQAWLNYPNSFSAVARGEGYFILSREGKNLKFDGAIAPTFSQSTLFQLNLVAGFNLIGNPYTMPINWEDSRTGIAGVGVVKLFQGGSYADGNTIEVFSGGFVFANAAVSVPVKLRTSPNGGRLAQLSLSSRIDDDEWIVPIKMTQGERQFNFGGIGMSGDASLSYDDKDDLAPPSPYGNFEISFAHPEHFMKKFSRDVVPTAEGFTWTFRAETEVIDGTVLSWDNSMFRDNTKDLFLLDVSLQRPVNMKEESSYSFDPNVSREFKIFFGKDANEKLKPNRIFLGQVSPNPATTLVTIPFNLPDTGSNLSVRLEILDRMGKPVETLLNKNLAAGFYSTTWDASASTVSGGLYIVRLAVQNQQHQESVATKLVINK
ncbi:MAG: hypothetical protein K2U26_12865 [Cyclobacteriaceae bacterium]|nr:hypothetical protein [Cyclobacteriaceae bacterium]